MQSLTIIRLATPGCRLWFRRELLLSKEGQNKIMLLLAACPPPPSALNLSFSSCTKETVNKAVVF
jgi:hypothetical protein